MCVALVQEPQCCNDVLFHATPLNPYSPFPHKRNRLLVKGCGSLLSQNISETEWGFQIEPLQLEKSSKTIRSNHLMLP